MYLKGCQPNTSHLKYVLNEEKDCPAKEMENYSKDTLKMSPNRPCWLANGTANFVFFCIPVGVIIVLNGMFFVLTVCNIRKRKMQQRKNNLRRFSRVKIPGDEDVKFYIQMAFILGFTWVIGFVQVFIESDINVRNLQIILLNSSTYFVHFYRT